jgi:hypothetical protein
MSSKTYIIAWNEAFDNCLDIDKQLSESDLDYKFWNVSSDKNKRPNWEVAKDIRYYGHFYNSLVDFMTTDKLVFGFNAGDPAYPDYPALIKKAEKVLERPGIYAPNIEGDLFAEDGVYLSESKLHPDSYLASQTNGICVFMHQDVAVMMFDFMFWMRFMKDLDFSKMKSGWGLDTVYCLMAMYNNLPIYRDKEVYVDHPEGSHYNANEAGKEMLLIETMFFEYAATKKWDVETLKLMKQNILAKARQRKKYGLLLETMYPNLKGELEA